MSNLLNFVFMWARQPTTIAGISAVLGTLSALVAHQVTWPQAVPLLVGAMVSIVLPDNAGAKATVESLGSATVNGVSGSKGV